MGYTYNGCADLTKTNQCKSSENVSEKLTLDTAKMDDDDDDDDDYEDDDYENDINIKDDALDNSNTRPDRQRTTTKKEGAKKKEESFLFKKIRVNK